NRWLEGRYLMYQGDQATDARDFARAAELFDRAQEAFEASGALGEQGRLHMSRSRLRLAHGDTGGCVEEARAGLRLQEENGEAIGAAQSLSAMAVASSRAGRHRSARRYFDRALEW